MISIQGNKCPKALSLLHKMPINTLFAEAVLSGNSSGQVFVDNVENPKTFYIIHSYGLGLLFGEHTNADFNNCFKNYLLNKGKIRKTTEWMQVYPSEWNGVIKEMLGDEIPKYTGDAVHKKLIEQDERVNFTFDKNQYLKYLKTKKKTDFQIVKTDENQFLEMTGSVIPTKFWNTYQEFNQQGIGFSLLEDNNLASLAFSAYMVENQLEIGIETVEQYRGKGFAEEVCVSIINYALKHNLEPVWACRLGNTGSYKLAKKLGFTPSYQLPFYKLSSIS